MDTPFLMELLMGLGVVAVIMGVIALFIDEARTRREWARLHAQFDERLKTLAATHGASFVPVTKTYENLSENRARRSVRRLQGALSTSAGVSCACELVSVNELDLKVSVTRSAPRRGRFNDLGLSLIPEGMALSINGQAYPLKLEQAQLVFELLNLEPWPSTLKSFIYDNSRVELTLEESLDTLQSAEVIARFDALWAQNERYFERFLQLGIDHSKAAQLQEALGLVGGDA